MEEKHEKLPLVLFQAEMRTWSIFTGYTTEADSLYAFFYILICITVLQLNLKTFVWAGLLVDQTKHLMIHV